MQLDFSVPKKEKVVVGGEADTSRRVSLRRLDGCEENGKTKTATWAAGRIALDFAILSRWMEKSQRYLLYPYTRLVYLNRFGLPF